MNLSMRKMAGFETNLYEKMDELGLQPGDWDLEHVEEEYLLTLRHRTFAVDYQQLAEALKPMFNPYYYESGIRRGLRFAPVVGPYGGEEPPSYDDYEPLIEVD